MKRKRGFLIIILCAIFLTLFLNRINAQVYNYGTTYTNGYVMIDGKVHYYNTMTNCYGFGPTYNTGQYKPTYSVNSKEWDYGWITFSIGSAVALVCGVCWAALAGGNDSQSEQYRNGDNALAIATYCGCGVVAVSIPLICVGDKKNKQLINK